METGVPLRNRDSYGRSIANPVATMTRHKVNTIALLAVGWSLQANRVDGALK